MGSELLFIGYLLGKASSSSGGPINSGCDMVASNCTRPFMSSIAYNHSLIQNNLFLIFIFIIIPIFLLFILKYLEYKQNKQFAKNHGTE